MSYPREILGNYSMQEEAGDSLSRPLLLSREDHDEAAGDVTSHLLHLGPPEVGGPAVPPSNVQPEDSRSRSRVQSM